MKYTFWFTLLLMLSNSFNICIANNGCSPVAVPGKNSLSGTVKNAATNAPLANATIFLHELKLSAVTDANGAYHFSALPAGGFTIEVSYVGFRSFIEWVVVQGATVKNILLAASVVESDNVTVTGVSAATQISRTPSYISIINKKELERSAGTHLLDVVAQQPGVSIVTTGPAIAKPFIRGLGYNRVVTINDGIRQEGQQWGDEHGLEVDEYSVQRIEVLRGPASLIYGSDAMGGVINVITNTPVPINTLRASIAGSMNSNNRMWGQYAAIAGNVNGINWNAYGSFKNAADYRNKYDGQVLNSRFNEKNFGGYVGLNKSWGYSHLIFSAYQQRPGIIEGKRDEYGNFIAEGYTLTDAQRNSRELLVPNQQIQHYKLALDNSFSLNNGNRITALVGVQRNQRKEFAKVDEPNNPQAYFDLTSMHYSLAYHTQVQGWKTSVGTNGMQQQNRNKGEEAIIPDYNLWDVGLYAYTSKTLNRLSISGGLRYDVRSLSSKYMLQEQEVKFQAFEKQLSSFSASAGLSYGLTDAVLLKANISRGFRAPNLSELAANGEHEGTGRYEIGNKNLQSETSFNVDAGIQWTTNHVELMVAGFVNRINNYIYYEKLLNAAGSDSVIQQVPAYRFAQQHAMLMGMEATIDLHPHPLDWLHFENTFSLVKGTFLQAVDASTNMPLIAPARLLTELRAEFASAGRHLKNFYIKVELDNVAAQNNFFAGFHTETATKGYTLLNAGLGSDIYISGKKRASLMMALNNCTDVAYQSHLSRLKYTDINPATQRVGVFNMGRTVNMRLIIPFEYKW